MRQAVQALAPLSDSFRAMHADLPSPPKAILMISGHWEENAYAVQSAAKPPMLYDYYNFPPETYEIQYPSPGAPDLADDARSLIEAAGLLTATDSERGYVHGTLRPWR